MSYDKNTGMIKAPLSISDVGRAIGSGSKDIGTLCTYKYLNRWAKYKPVRYGKAFINDPVVAGLFAGTGPDKNWWKAGSGNFGINIPWGFTPMEAAVKSWEYLRPQGGASSAFRLSDFIGYVNNLSEYEGLKCPIEFSFPLNADNRHPFICHFNLVAKTGSLLGIKDLFSSLKHGLWDNFTLGMFLKDPNSAEYVFVTTDYLNTINADYLGRQEIEIRVGHPINYPNVFKDRQTSIEIYPVICNKRFLEPISNSSMEFLPDDNYSLRCLPELPEFYISTIVPYVQPELYSVDVRYETEPSGGGGTAMKVYVKLSITSEFQQGGHLSYRIMFSRGKNITDPVLPHYEYGEIGINAGSPIGTQEEKLAATIYFEHTPETTDARVEITVQDTGNEFNPVAREIAEWEWRQ